jgi:hypothetical protein
VRDNSWTCAPSSSIGERQAADRRSPDILQHTRSLRVRMLDYPAMEIDHRPFLAEDGRSTGFDIRSIVCWRNAPCCPAHSP